MTARRPLRIGLDIGILGINSEGIRHWTVQTFRAMIRDNPHHQFTLIWPFPHTDPEACGLLSGPNTDLYVVRPRALWRRVGRRLGLLDETARCVRFARGLDALFWAQTTDWGNHWWLHRVPDVPKVVALFDATPLVTPEYHGPDNVRAWKVLFDRAREIGSWWLTISEHARQDLVRAAALDPDRGRVVYPGHNFDGSDGRPLPDGPLPPDLADQIGGDPFVLTVGTLEPRKNHVRLFRAFRELVSRPEFARWKLVVVGREGWLYDDIVAEAKRTPGVILAGRRSHEELAALYRHAAVFAFPSLYEGFGLPVAEAMSFGRPVLTSSATSLPEVAGDAAVLVDPHSDDAVRDGLARLMADPDLRAKLGAAAPAQAAKFRWDRAARETMTFLEEVAAGRP